jgi:hypothetical protein
MVLAGVVLAGAVMVTAARANSISELLEKGIYTEETVGDLDRAIAIYEKVVAEAKAGYRSAAVAQFHIGQCLLKKGKQAEAKAAFAKLIADFPDAKDLVAEARKHVPAGLPLGPVPWVDGEVLALRLRMATGLEIGALVYTVQAAEREGRKVWRVGSRTLITLAKMTGVSRVDADWNTFQPIEGMFQNSLLGSCVAKFEGNRAQVVIERPDGGQATTKTIELSRVVYDNEQAMDVLRRLPLVKGYKATLTVLGELGAGEISIPIEVQGTESVRVPAGEFECFRIHLGVVNQTFWYATAPHRYLVKFSANGVEAELVSIGQLKPGVPLRYADAKLGFSLAAPNDWVLTPVTPLGNKHTAVVYLLTPELRVNSFVAVDKLTEPQAEPAEVLRGWADAGIDASRKVRQDYKLRPDGRQQRTVGGRPALSVIADYTDGKRQMVEYATYVDDRAARLKFAFNALVPRDQFDAFRKSFDALVDSLQVKQP